MVTGRVVRFDEAKGYGFIAPDSGEDDDVFVHAKELAEAGVRLRTGALVQFETIDGGRGPKAYNVRVLENPNPSADPAVTAPTSGRRPDAPPDDEDLYEILSENEFLRVITDLLLGSAPQLTAAQINEIRGRLVRLARKNGWVE